MSRDGLDSGITDQHSLSQAQCVQIDTSYPLRISSVSYKVEWLCREERD